VGDPAFDLDHHLSDLARRDYFEGLYAEWRKEAEDDVRRAVKDRDLDWLERLLGCDPLDEDLFDEDEVWRERAIQGATDARFEQIKAFREGD
jgi:hypothetical protein